MSGEPAGYQIMRNDYYGRCYYKPLLYSETNVFDADRAPRWMEKRGRVNACGLYDLGRQPRPVAVAYRQLIENFGRISSMAHAEMFVLTTEAAHLETSA